MQKAAYKQVGEGRGESSVGLLHFFFDSQSKMPAKISTTSDAKILVASPFD